MRLIGQLYSSLQWWLKSTCTCDGYSNLHNPNLTCLDKQTGIITITVHPNGLLSAQEFIDLARADIQMVCTLCRRNSITIQTTNCIVMEALKFIMNFCLR